METSTKSTTTNNSFSRIQALVAGTAARETVFICCLLVLATVAVYWPVLHFGFVNYDDRTFVLDNPSVQQGVTVKSVLWAFQSLFIYWQPLTWISYMVDFQRYHLNASGYHFTNLLLHLANTVLLFVVWKRMTGALACSAVVAGLFALHPMHVETVAWVAERKGVLSGLFWMLSLLAYVRYVKRPKPAAYLLVIFCFTLGLMSKSMVVTLPCVLLLLDYWPLRRFASAKKTPGKRTPLAEPSFPTRKPSQLLLEKLPLFALSVFSSVMTILAQQQMGAIISTEMFSLPVRVEQSLVCYAVYIRKLFWPSGLAVFYPNPGTWPAGQIGLAAVVLLTITALSLAQARRRPYLIVGWLWFVGMLVPVIGLFQTGEQSMADRYTYLPLIGLFIALTWGLADLLAKVKLGTMALRCFALAVLWLCAIVAGRQLQTWKDTKSLFTHANAVTTNNYFADTVLGMLLTSEGKTDEAISHFTAALKVQPHYSLIHYGLADALAIQKKFEPAITHYLAALQYDPDNLDTHFHLAAVYQTTGELEKAASEYAGVLKLHPDSALAVYNIATIRHAQRRYPEALELYKQALKLKPSNTPALNNAAWILATHTNSTLRNGTEAVRFAELACQLTGRKVPVFLGTLAAAYAEQGNFAAAITTAQEAENTARDSGQKEVAEKNHQLLDLYRINKACREETP